MLFIHIVNHEHKFFDSSNKVKTSINTFFNIVRFEHDYLNEHSERVSLFKCKHSTDLSLASSLKDIHS
jgi:hypothetical protein